ncbi:hypothetical protein V6N13_098330 [Hibiscus sabdariffa]
MHRDGGEVQRSLDDRKVLREGEFGKQQPNSVVTIFVSYLPRRLHWQGLWASFAHHGDVLDTFIPAKLSRDGSGFGFVRFTNIVDAQRAITRLDGFKLFGNRLSVSIAKYNVRSQYWKKIQSSKNVLDLPSPKIIKDCSLGCVQSPVEV